MVKLALIFVGVSLAGCSLIAPKPTVEPICNDDIYVSKLDTPIIVCRDLHPLVSIPIERRGRSDSNRDRQPYFRHKEKPDERPDHKPDERPDHKPDERPDHKPDHKPKEKPVATDRGNPGNDKPVGKSGEQDKDTGGSGGSKGASTGKT